uniref:Uncharacterized protein n=1 Tax=Branchiostoma floridae TaxID=7739 RepID=C3ZPM3_BRAFL|eukprot:XP_002589509.1 hypothetical protein BRAFLDRAFT_88374 [Branchiostoma floridae]
MAEKSNMEVRKVIGNLEAEDEETTRTPSVKVKKKPPFLQKESVRSTRRVQVQAGPSCGDDELDRLYATRKTAVFPPAAVRPKEPPPQPADVPCRPPDPLYVRRVGQRFWSTKRILDWQRQALRAMEDPEALLKPVREYGEEPKLQNAENGESDANHGHPKNYEEHKYFLYDKNHGHYENDEEHKYFQYDKNHGHYENDEEHTARHYENDEEHTARHHDNGRHHENDEENSNLSMHVYADLDPDFLAVQDAIQNASAQPFYEMDISPADEEQEQPFYKMDVTAAKDKVEEEQPFYEMKAASADGENEQQPFYKMDDNQLGQPTPDNVYADLDAEFVAAQDAVCMRHRVREDSRDGADQRCSQNCREFCRSRPGCVLAVCVGVIIAVTAATVVAVIFNQHSRLRFHHNESPVLNHTTLSTVYTTSCAHLAVTSPATSETSDWRTEWTLYIREYFQQDSDAAMGLEERYSENEVVIALLEDRFFWPWVCLYWEHKTALPHTMLDAVTSCIVDGTESKYMESHGFSTYMEFFSSMLGALNALPNITQSSQSSDNRYISLSERTLSNNDAEALVNLFPYLKGLKGLFLQNCGLSGKAAATIAGQLPLLRTVTIIFLSSNKIGDDGVEAMSEAFPHLKALMRLYIANNSITNVGGRAMAKRLGHLQELQSLNLKDNELALSLSSLTKAFVNMTQLRSVRLWPITCRAASFRMAAQQVHDAVHRLEGQVRNTRNVLLYDGSTGSRVGTLGMAWKRVEHVLTTGVYISKGHIKMSLKIKLLEE